VRWLWSAARALLDGRRSAWLKSAGPPPGARRWPAPQGDGRPVQAGVPVYLHPREPLPDQQVIYAGYESLVRSAWGFGYETATHAVRLMPAAL